jgi:hypothetical protein
MGMGLPQDKAGLFKQRFAAGVEAVPFPSKQQFREVISGMVTCDT